MKILIFGLLVFETHCSRVRKKSVSDEFTAGQSSKPTFEGEDTIGYMTKHSFGYDKNRQIKVTTPSNIKLKISLATSDQAILLGAADDAKSTTYALEIEGVKDGDFASLDFYDYELPKGRKFILHRKGDSTCQNSKSYSTDSGKIKDTRNSQFQDEFSMRNGTMLVSFIDSKLVTEKFGVINKTSAVTNLQVENDQLTWASADPSSTFIITDQSNFSKEVNFFEATKEKKFTLKNLDSKYYVFALNDCEEPSDPISISVKSGEEIASSMGYYFYFTPGTPVATIYVDSADPEKTDFSSPKRNVDTLCKASIPVDLSTYKLPMALTTFESATAGALSRLIEGLPDLTIFMGSDNIKTSSMNLHQFIELGYTDFTDLLDLHNFDVFSPFTSHILINISKTPGVTCSAANLNINKPKIFEINYVNAQSTYNGRISSVWTDTTLGGIKDEFYVGCPGRNVTVPCLVSFETDSLE